MDVIWTCLAPMTFCDHVFSSHDIQDLVAQGGVVKGNNLKDCDNPETVEEGDWVFVEQGDLSTFLEDVFPRIQNPFVLFTIGWFLNAWKDPESWDDEFVPPTLRDAVDSSKVLLWVTKNAFVRHPKAMGVPIGIHPLHVKEFQSVMDADVARTTNTIVSVSYGANNPIRKQLPAIPRQTPEEHFLAIAQAKACLSPTGDCADCYRHLECIGLGTIPVINRNHADRVFQRQLEDLYGSSAQFVDAESLAALVGASVPDSWPQPDRSLVFVETWVRRIKARLVEISRP